MNIPIPALAILASPHDQGPGRETNALRARHSRHLRFYEAMTEHQAAWVERRGTGAGWSACAMRITICSSHTRRTCKERSPHS
jgi:hypothetical protein